jgi:nitrite reductase (NAD(P)H)
MANETEPVPILTPGIEPTSGESHSPPSSLPTKGVWEIKNGQTSNKEGEDVGVEAASGKKERTSDYGFPKGEARKKLVVVGLGMVGVAFM